MSGPAVTVVAGAAREALRTRLQGLGFAAVRFAASRAPDDQGLRPWLEDGRHADMAWMERTAAKRTAPQLVLPGVRTIIALGVNYGPGKAADPAGRPRWARYVLHQDYHDTIKPGLVAAGKILEELGVGAGDYRWYVDTGPVLERGWAARSGLGFLGKNAMLISPEFGNWLFLAVILTRLEIESDAPRRAARPRPAGAPEPAGLLCGKCTRCLTACPTQAFPEPGVVDARRCISYQTIENKGIIPRELRPGIGDRIFGCDTCLEVCPWNRFAQAGRSVLLSVRTGPTQLSLADLLALTPERFATVFRGTAVKRLKLTGLLRNACIVAGNSRDATLVPVLLPLATHPHPLVRAHAVWALRRLAPAEAMELLRAAHSAETDAAVLEEYAAP
ncbi:MAG: tRNA epoxyqueuosine(34) reductase QueG [Opitutales bacterium]